MHVLMLTHNRAEMGGSFRRVSALAHGLARLGHAVTVYSGRTNAGLSHLHQISAGVHLVQPADLFPTRLRQGGLSPMDIFSRLRHTAQAPVDLVHGFDHRPAVALPSLWVQMRQQVPFVSDWADLWGAGGILDLRPGWERWLLGPYDRWMEARLRRWADGVTVISQTLYAQVRTLSVPAAHIHHLPVGAPIEEIYPMDKQAMRLKHKLPTDRPIVLHSGFTPYDSDFVAVLLPALVRHLPDVLLITAGEYLQSLAQVVATNGLGRNVHQYGYVPYDRLGELLACGDVMILPYRNRLVNQARFPTRFGDFLAAGRPVVTNPTGELGALVQREAVGLVAPEDPTAFAAIVADLLARPEQQAWFGARARQLAETRLSWPRLADELATFYAEITSRVAHGRRQRQ